jgi:2-hydroxychromene-2-carboxylate isomerase
MGVAEIPGGPYDVEFFFDPGCPFAWQASVWMRRVAELRGVRVGWRFISLKLINEGNERSPELAEAHERGHRYLRMCAAARERLDNDAVAAMYREWGERYWYVDADGEYGERMAAGAREAHPKEILEALGLPADLLEAADDPSYDEVIRAETDEAFRRTGDGVGTPIVTYDPPHGNSLFGPVISEVPDDERAVAFYDALRTFADFEGFSELKRTQRPPLDLPLLAS